MQKLRRLVQGDDRFRPYLKVLNEFGFGDKTSALLLSTIYPIGDFFRDGRPEVVNSQEKPRETKIKLARAYTRRKVSILLFESLVAELLH